MSLSNLFNRTFKKIGSVNRPYFLQFSTVLIFNLNTDGADHMASMQSREKRVSMTLQYL